MHALRLVLTTLVLLTLGLSSVEAQPTDFVNVSDTLSSNGDSFVVQVRGMSAARFQPKDSYSGTWEVQCSVDGGTTYDADAEVNLFLEGAASTAVQSVTDTVGIWLANVSGCTHIKVIATAGFAATDTQIAVMAVPGSHSMLAAIVTAATGSLTNDSAAAAGNRIATLPVITETSAPSRTNGRDAALSGTAGGAIRVMITDAAGAATSIATDATHDSAASSTGPQVMAVASAEGSAPTAVTAGDAVRPRATLTGTVYTRNVDPCSDEANKVYFPVDIVTATTTEIANQSASNYFRICSINLITAGANNVAIVEDDTDACASPTAGMNGGVTAGEGWNFPANGGISLGNGSSTIMRSAAVNRYVCIITSAAVQLSGTVVYALAP